MLRNFVAGLFLALFLVFPVKAAERQVPGSAAEVQLSFAPVVKRVAPAVVNVYATRMVRTPAFGDLFSQLFGNQLFGDQFGPARPRQQQALGSGVIISPDGLIVTNLHVVADADQVKVALPDKGEFSADIVVKNERSDLAFLRIQGDPGPLPTVPFADSDSVEVGDLVLAIGDPFGVGQSVTSGIVSAFARVPGGSSQDQYFIQTDAAINPGNSGGALVDLQGRLIGINRMIYSNSGQSAGIGFAIPSNVVRLAATAAEHGGIVQRPWIGAELQDLTPDLAASLGLNRQAGVLVASVAKGGPAAAAGIVANDVIVAIDDHDVQDTGALGYRLATSPVGGTAKVLFLRGGKRFQTNLSLVPAPEVPPRDARTISGDSPFSGLTVFNLSPAVAEEFSYNGPAKGVIVGDVDAGSTADRLNFQKGDVIVAINGASMSSTGDVVKAAGQPSRSWDFTVSRNGQMLTQRLFAR